MIQAQAPFARRSATAADTLDFDAIVVGARVAGAATAAHLARQGAQVLLVDRATFPAPTVSCPIFYGNSIAMFERIGVLDAIEALGAPRIRYYGSRLPQFDLVARLPPSHGRDYAYSIRRDRLDTAVLRRVASYPGVTLREGFSVSELVWSQGRVVGVRGRQGHNAEETIYARAVIGADGKRSLVARAVDAPIYAELPGQTCIFYAYYRGVTPLDEPSAVVHIGEDGKTAALVFDADDDLTVISVGVPADEFAAARQDPEGTLLRVCNSMPALAPRCRNIERATPVMGQGPAASFYRRSFGPGWALVGDAGHYIDPITGQGINNALRSAELFADAWRNSARRGGWQAAMAEYQRRRDAETRPMFDLISLGTRLDAAARSGIDIGTPLLRAIARNPDIATNYAGVYNGAVPVNAFFHPLNLARVLITDNLRHALPLPAGRLAASEPAT